ncbi:MAG: hypothetical protein WCF26_06805 [Candidatus Sulfotelmatobacter sp.]
MLLFLFVMGCSVLWGQTDAARGFSLGIDSIHTTDDMCLILGARAIAEDFFKGLEAHKSGERRMFKRHGKIVKVFPAQLTVKIEAALAPCAAKITLACDRCDFRFDDEFMKSLQFDAFWKRGFDQRKAEVNVLGEEESHDLAPTAKLWKYDFSVNSKDVPLTESLLVVLHAPNGRIVSRLSGRP